MKLDKKELNRLTEVAKAATPGPWGPWNSNYPFYVNVQKPSPSLSKHDDKRPTYWSFADGVHVLQFNPKFMLDLLEEIERLKEIEAMYESRK